MHPKVTATLTDGTPLKLVRGPDLSGNWEFEIPFWAIRWKGTPHNDIGDNILDITIHFSNPGALGRNRLARHFRLFQHPVSFHLRLYFDEDDTEDRARTNSWAVNNVALIDGFEGENDVLRVSLRSHDASMYFAPTASAMEGHAAFPPPGTDEPDFGMAQFSSNDFFPLLLIPTMLITIQQGNPVMQMVYSSTAASPI